MAASFFMCTRKEMAFYSVLLDGIYSMVEVKIAYLLDFLIPAPMFNPTPTPTPTPPQQWRFCVAL